MKVRATVLTVVLGFAFSIEALAAKDVTKIVNDTHFIEAYGYAYDGCNYTDVNVRVNQTIVERKEPGAHKTSETTLAAGVWVYFQDCAGDFSQLHGASTDVGFDINDNGDGMIYGTAEVSDGAGRVVPVTFRVHTVKTPMGLRDKRESNAEFVIPRAYRDDAREYRWSHQATQSGEITYDGMHTVVDGPLVC